MTDLVRALKTIKSMYGLISQQDLKQDYKDMCKEAVITFDRLVQKLTDDGK